MECQVLFSASAEETFLIGRRIAVLLYPGSIIALNGKLGSGKTSLAKGIADGLGIKENLTSPTYTIISEYSSSDHCSNDNCSNCHCRTPVLYHIDAYRLNGDSDFENIGGEEILASGGICIIEWSERIPKSLPDKIITIVMEITGPSSRKINIDGLEKL